MAMPMEVSYEHSEPKRQRLEHMSKCGTIESISLKNFMCHGSLVQKLGSHINILIGRNSSGKSSILTAILIGLGGKATDTERGTMLRGFIKNGQSYAQVIVQLRNVGSDAYQAEKYGDAIIVSRKFTIEGKSYYKIRSASGRLISTTKAELCNIVDHFNIQVDNPITILNQEASRSFLVSSNPRKMYKFFLYATQLYQIQRDYTVILEQKTVTEDSICIRKQQLNDLMMEVKKWEDKAKDVLRLEGLIKKRDSLFRLAAWASVIEQEKNRDMVVKQMKEVEKKLTEAELRIKQEQTAADKTQECYTGCEERFQDLELQLKKTTELHQEAARSRNCHRNSLKIVKRSIDRNKSKLKAAEKDISIIKERIEEEAQRDEDQMEEEKQIRMGRMKDLQEEINQIEPKHDKMATECDKLLASVTQTRESLFNMRTTQKEEQAQVSALQKQLATLEDSRWDRLKLYGRHIPALVAEINKVHQKKLFHEKPKGPLGMYLTVQNAKTWALAVEVCLGGLLYNFCCTDHHDTRILKNIYKKVIPKDVRQPGIITAKFDHVPYDTHVHKVHCDRYPALMEVVHVDDAVIFNTIIDQRRADQILLIEDKMVAQHFLKYTPPRNCKECYTKEGDHVYAGLEQRYYSCPQNRYRVLQSNIEDELRNMRRKFDRAQTTLKETLSQSEKLQSKLKTSEDQRKELNQRLKKTKIHLASLHSELKTLEEEEKIEVNTTIVFDLSQDLNESENLVSELTKSQNKLLKEYNEGQETLRKLEEEYNRTDDDMNRLTDQIEPLKEKLCALSLDQVSASHVLGRHKEKRAEYTNERDALRKEIQQWNKKVTMVTEKAKLFSRERIKVQRSPGSIDSQIRELSRRIEKEQKCKGNGRDIQKEYNKAKKDYTQKQRYVFKMELFIEKLNKMMELRQGMYRDFCRGIAARTKGQFITKMAQRNFSGQLIFDHQKEELTIKVEGGASDLEDNGNVLQLSGGEKSFSTVCLLMALWDSVESPFKAMDEFDVCMDMVNRRNALESLIQYGHANLRDQYLFISPLDMSSVTPNPYLIVHQLQSPQHDRQQMTWTKSNE